MEAPRQVKLAIVLLTIVLFGKGIDGIRKVLLDPAANADIMLKSIWLALSLGATAVTACLIILAWKRRNWGRIALLIWTVGSWSLWFIWPPRIGDYSWWKWLISGGLIAMELCAIVLLFSGSGARWYRPAHQSSSAL